MRLRPLLTLGPRFPVFRSYVVETRGNAEKAAVIPDLQEVGDSPILEGDVVKLSLQVIVGVLS